MSIPIVDEPLGRPSPYILPPVTGESMTIPGTKTVVRILASAKETDRLISVFKFDGVTGDPAGFHYHNYAHDIFMVTKGQVKVWAGDQCRILSAGDFASVPPKVIHCPQLVGQIDETIGLVTPGDWVDFFRFVSDKYTGSFANELDDRNTMAAMFPKFQEIKEKYDVIFQPHHVPCPVGEWTEADHVIPQDTEMYYLQANKGPRFLLGGILSRPFITTKQSDSKFAITSIESSSAYGKSVLSKSFSFSKVHQVYCVLDGCLVVLMDGKENPVHAGETVFIPAGTTVSLDFKSRYVRFWSYSSGDGLETLISEAGSSFSGFVVPDTAAEVNNDKVRDVASKIGMEIEI